MNVNYILTTKSIKQWTKSAVPWHIPCMNSAKKNVLEQNCTHKKCEIKPTHRQTKPIKLEMLHSEHRLALPRTMDVILCN